MAKNIEVTGYISKGSGEATMIQYDYTDQLTGKSVSDEYTFSSDDFFYPSNETPEGLLDALKERLSDEKIAELDQKLLSAQEEEEGED